VNIEELAFKNYFELKEIQKVDLLLIIEFLQKDRKQWINQYTQAHNDYVVLQQENQLLKEQKENLQNIVCNKIMTDYDIETPLKDELSKQILKNTVLEESKNITENILDELEKWLKEIRNECSEIYSSPITQDATREFYYIDVIDKTLNKLQELKGSDKNE